MFHIPMLISKNFPLLFNDLPLIWQEFIRPNITENNYDQLNKLSDFVLEQIKNKPDKIFPEQSQIFSAFELPPEKIKCVIIGQDPYHGKSQANGLAFSVNKNTNIPPTLKNIFKELEDDLNVSYPKNGDLTKWKENGILLLNSVLTVEEKKPTSHAEKGWETFTNLIIKTLSQKRKNLVFILWGNYAKGKIFFIDQNEDSTKHLVLISTHPSPYSAFGKAGSQIQSFYKSKPFSKTNEYLVQNNIEPIDWTIETNNKAP